MVNLALLGSFILLLGRASVSAADPVPFDSTSGTCNNSAIVQGNTVPGPSVNVVARVQISGSGSGEVYGEENGPEGDLEFYAGPDTLWLDLGAWNEQPLVEMTCPSPVTYTADFYSVPPAPISFTGASTYSSTDGYANVDSQLPFIAATNDAYRAVVTIQQGGIVLGPPPPASPSTITSSGTYNIGNLAAGQGYEIGVGALDGPQAQWTISIQPAPVVLSGVSATPATIRSGKTSAIAYNVSGDTDITADVLNAGNRVVRVLATNLPVSMGAHTLTWDGRTSADQEASPGNYTVNLQSVDSQANVSKGLARVQVKPYAWMAEACGLPPLVQHPSSFSFSCDANVVFKHVRWDGWGTAKAIGHGTLYLVKSCDPDCAAAPRYEYSARIVADGVAYCGAREVYTTVTAYTKHRTVDGRRVLHDLKLQACE